MVAEAVIAEAAMEAAVALEEKEAAEEMMIAVVKEEKMAIVNLKEEAEVEVNLAALTLEKDVALKERVISFS